MEIPELDALIGTNTRSNEWTDDEEDTLLRYYRKVPYQKLMNYLPGRTYKATRFHVHKMKKEGLWREE